MSCLIAENCLIESFHLGVKTLIINPEKKLLLLERHHPSKKIYWDLPGGRLQQGEDILSALKREVNEETGLDDFNHVNHLTTVVSDIRISTQNGSVGLIFSIFRQDLSFFFEPILSSEHVCFEWVFPSEAALKLTQYPFEFKESLKKIV